MNRYFHEELEAVRSNLMIMGERAIENVNLAMNALIEGNLELVEKARSADDVLDDIEALIDEEVARYINLRAPVARDLRLLFVAIKASHDLERVGDEATSIAKRSRAILLAGHETSDLAKVPRMCELALEMLRDALHCFIEEKADAAFSISARDKEVDDLNRANFKYFVERMTNDSTLVLPCTEMVFISKSFERIADHAQNIAEEAYYLLTAGSLKEAIRKGK